MSDPVHAPPDQYLDLVTSEHNQRPKFMAWLAVLLQAFVDDVSVLLSLPSSFDLDYAVGAQLDATGEWIGLSRFVPAPLPNVFFSFDTEHLGWDEAVWRTKYDPIEGLVRLPDQHYRLALRAKVIANHWDGTIPGAYAAYEQLLQGLACHIGIQDNENMSITVALFGTTPDALMQSIFVHGLLDLRPSAVRVDNYLLPSIDNSPYFGFDIENGSIAGWETGTWGRVFPGK